jgi:1-phosphofructokinase
MTGATGMIVTLTANPSVDRTIEVDRLVRGAVLRATNARVDPGGKGVNVARALAANAAPVRAVLPCGGAEGLQLVALLAQSGIEVIEVPIDGAVRANVSVAEPDGTLTKLNEPGPELGAAELAALVDATVAAAHGATWTVLSGSLPPGAPVDFYADLTRRLHAAGTLVAVDSSGPALVAALEAGPDLVKPNHEELAEVVGTPIATLADAAAAARALRARGAGQVLASLGAAGALLADAAGVTHAEAFVARPRSTVGAGDSALAGFLFAGGAGTDALAAAVQWGASAASLPGSRLPGPADLVSVSVTVHDLLDAERVLKGEPHALDHR